MFPGVKQAMSHLLLEGELVNFRNNAVKQQVLKQVEKCSEGDFGERPFVSAGQDLEALIPFGLQKCVYYEKKGKTVKMTYVRIDLVGM